MSTSHPSTLISLDAHPFTLFQTWFSDAEEHEPNDPNAMYLATSTSQGSPSLRAVLLKGHDHRGFVFYTNLQSRKGRELAENPVAALLFHWKSLRRQIRIEGPTEPVTPAEADAYFASRRKESRIGAVASDQSRPMPDRATFERRIREVDARYGDAGPPRPENWSGYRVRPLTMEFWQDRDFRMHDRVAWRREALTHETWHATRLYP